MKISHRSPIKRTPLGAKDTNVDIFAKYGRSNRGMPTLGNLESYELGKRRVAKFGTIKPVITSKLIFILIIT